MSTNKTTNYLLHSWVGTDYVKRSEFNDNFTAIDTQMKANADSAASATSALNTHKAKQAASGTDTTKEKHISDADYKNWEDHRANTSNPHSVTASQVGAYSKTEADGRFETPTGAQTKASTAETNAKTYADTVSGNAQTSAINFAKGYGLGSVSKSLSSGDLNTLAAESGFYYIANTAVSNKPSTALGWLIQQALNSTNITQIYITVTNIIYVRTNNAGTWSAWKQIAYTDLATTSAAGLMSSSDKSKLDGIAAGAQVNTVTSVAGKTGAVTLTPTDVGAAASSHTHTATDLPSASTTAAGVVQLNTTTNSTATNQAATASAVKAAYDLAATKADTTVVTTSANGLMISTDKAKLDGVAAGAQVNQNAFSTVSAGGTSIASNSTTDTFTIASTAPIIVAGDAANKRVNLSFNDGSTTQKGAVQLYNGIDSTSTALAATAASAKKAYDDSVAYTKSYGLGIGTNVLANNTDLNTVLKSGFYRLNSTHTNVPGSAAYANGQLIVSVGNNTSDTVTQLLFPFATAEMYIRSGNTNGNANGTWTSWARISSLDYVGFGYAIQNYTAVDLNSFNSNGQYYINDGINRPVSENGYLISTVLSAGTYQMQQYIVHTNAEKYIRVRVNGTWGQWIPLTSNPFVYLKGGQWGGIGSASTEIFFPVNLSNTSPIEWYYNNGFSNGAYGELICGIAGKYDIYAQGFISGLNQYQEFMMRIRQVNASDGRISNVTHGIYGFSGLGSNYNPPSGIPCHVSAVFDLKVGDKLSFACICSEAPRNINSFSLKAVRIAN